MSTGEDGCFSVQLSFAKSDPMHESVFVRIQAHSYHPIINPALKASAVLVPFVKCDNQLGLLFTQRSEKMKHHPGQISFPGGKLEKGETAWECALREANEEVGISQVSFMGRLDDVISPKGFHIQCLAGLVQSSDLLINKDEVVKTFWVPLTEVLDLQRHEARPWKKIPGVTVHYFHFSDCLVWGVTGKITFLLREILRKDTAESAISYERGSGRELPDLWR